LGFPKRLNHESTMAVPFTIGCAPLQLSDRLSLGCGGHLTFSACPAFFPRTTTDEGDDKMTVIAADRFTVQALPRQVASYVREHGRDPVWGHEALTQLATGFGPCRLCLRTFREHEEMRTLFTYDTYAGVSKYPQPGPVYIHAAHCERYDGGGVPAELCGLELTFEGVAAGPRVVALERTADEAAVEDAIARLLDLPDVDFVNVRNMEAGCFIARIARIDREAT